MDKELTLELLEAESSMVSDDVTHGARNHAAQNRKAFDLNQSELEGWKRMNGIENTSRGSNLKNLISDRISLDKQEKESNYLKVVQKPIVLKKPPQNIQINIIQPSSVDQSIFKIPVVEASSPKPREISILQAKDKKENMTKTTNLANQMFDADEPSKPIKNLPISKISNCNEIKIKYMQEPRNFHWRPKIKKSSILPTSQSQSQHNQTPENRIIPLEIIQIAAKAERLMSQEQRSAAQKETPQPDLIKRAATSLNSKRRQAQQKNNDCTSEFSVLFREPKLQDYDQLLGKAKNMFKVSLMKKKENKELDCSATARIDTLASVQSNKSSNCKRHLRIAFSPNITKTSYFQASPILASAASPPSRTLPEAVHTAISNFWSKLKLKDQNALPATPNHSIQRFQGTSPMKRLMLRRKEVLGGASQTPSLSWQLSMSIERNKSKLHYRH